MAIVNSNVSATAYNKSREMIGGSDHTRSVSIGKLDTAQAVASGADAKIWAIGNALAPCLETDQYVPMRMELRIVSNIYDDTVQP